MIFILDSALWNSLTPKFTHLKNLPNVEEGETVNIRGKIIFYHETPKIDGVEEYSNSAYCL